MKEESYRDQHINTFFINISDMLSKWLHCGPDHFCKGEEMDGNTLISTDGSNKQHYKLKYEMLYCDKGGKWTENKEKNVFPISFIVWRYLQ